MLTLLPCGRAVGNASVTSDAARWVEVDTTVGIGATRLHNRVVNETDDDDGRRPPPVECEAIGSSHVTTGRIEIDDVQPVVSGGRFPAKAVVGEVVPVSATVWREGHDAVAATLVVRYHGTTYPALADEPAGRVRTTEAVPIQEVVSPAPRTRPMTLPMATGRTADVFHGQFSPDTVGLWTYRVDGWSDPIATWRHHVIAKLDAGQSEGELSNDLLVGRNCWSGRRRASPARIATR